MRYYGVNFPAALRGTVFDSVTPVQQKGTRLALTEAGVCPVLSHWMIAYLLTAAVKGNFTGLLYRVFISVLFN